MFSLVPRGRTLADAQAPVPMSDRRKTNRPNTDDLRGSIAHLSFLAPRSRHVVTPRGPSSRTRAKTPTRCEQGRQSLSSSKAVPTAGPSILLRLAPPPVGAFTVLVARRV